MARPKKREPVLRNVLGELKQETKRGVLAVLFFVLGLLLFLGAFGSAGVVGDSVFRGLSYLLGVGYYLLPTILIVFSIALARELDHSIGASRWIGSAILFISGLGFIEATLPARGGLFGELIASPLLALFDFYATVLILGALSIASLLVFADTELSLGRLAFWNRLSLPSFRREKEDEPTIIEPDYAEDDDEEPEEPREEEDKDDEPDEDEEREPTVSVFSDSAKSTGGQSLSYRFSGTYTPPPLSLLEKDKGKPGVGDIKANANIIKRTLQNFGIQVELDEISIGPSVTRYAIKPAEGVRLSKIVSLQTNLELALAAHPVRIEAPIPGKSLVGIEMPNSAKTTVGLASLLGSDEYQKSEKRLLVSLGRDIAGKAHFADLAKMPHLLVAGATGSGKSVTIHALITSLLFRNSPEHLRFIMIDPKRVELTLYKGIPHLLAPVITDAKKAILALKWAAKEMDRRYDILEAESVRDIQSYHKNVLAPALAKGARDGDEKAPEQMPYIVIVLDELADIMQTYPRELESAIVRLAQMSRAVGIHLVLSTQRPSVNVITGLIKANVPARVALQVASQFDSRTIIDQGGAENLLGAGDMLYLSGDMPKPVRIQSAFISESELKKIVKHLKDNHEPGLDEVDFAAAGNGSTENALFSASLDGDDVDDDLYEEARVTVTQAGKASTSFLQRKLRIGYARAARLIDLLEEKGVIGPGEGAKPREVIGARPAAGGPADGE